MATRLIVDAIVTCDAEGTIYRPGALDIEGDSIAWAGRLADAPPRDAMTTLNFGGVLIPGLVNTHCHSPMTLLRGAAEDVPLLTFLREILWPREAKFDHDDIYWGMLLGIGEQLRAGVTTTCEMYTHQEAIMQAVIEGGSRCVLTPGVMDAPGWLSWKDRLREVISFADENAAAHERVTIGIAAHSAYTLPLDALDAVAAAARERGLLVHIHVAETRSEAAAVEKAAGMTIPALLESRGFLEGPTLTAHSVWVTDGDLDIYQRRDVAVAHCPQSNAKLAAGVARLTQMLDRGLRVGLGTDSPSANNDSDLWDEVRLAPLLARVTTGEPDAIPAPTALRLATAGGAAAVRHDRIGTLAAGRLADIVHLRSDDPAFVPILSDRDVVSHLVWSANSRLVENVWVGGERVVENGACISVDVERAMHEVQTRAARVAA